MNVKLGKNKIEQLIKCVINKYEEDTGEEIIITQTPSNYIGLADTLTERAKELHTREGKAFPEDNYLITPVQVRSAFFGQVDSLKDYFYEACCLYLNDKLSKDCPPQLEAPVVEKSEEIVPVYPDLSKRYRLLSIASLAILTCLVFFIFQWYTLKTKFDTIKKDMKSVAYKPSAAERDSLEGVWEVYTGSPQVRKNGPHGYHMTVTNIMEIKYKNGYFTFNRYGPSFNQLGYIQFEAPNLVSIHSYFNNDTDVVVSPKHTLMKLEPGKRYKTAISASWSFDPVEDEIIGIREVFTKLGKGGLLEVLKDKKENGSCPECKIIHWHRKNNRVDTLLSRNQLLDSLPLPIQKLVDENSIILKDPEHL